MKQGGSWERDFSYHLKPVDCLTLFLIVITLSYLNVYYFIKPLRVVVTMQ